MSLLTRRELEILSHLSAGYLDKEIAHVVGILCGLVGFGRVLVILDSTIGSNRRSDLQQHSQ